MREFIRGYLGSQDISTVIHLLQPWKNFETVLCRNYQSTYKSFPWLLSCYLLFPSPPITCSHSAQSKDMYRCNGLKSSLLSPLSLKKRIQDLNYELPFTPAKPCSTTRCSPWWAIANPDTTCSPTWDGPLSSKTSASFLARCTLGNTPPSAGLQPCLHCYFSAPESISSEGPSTLIWE